MIRPSSLWAFSFGSNPPGLVLARQDCASLYILNHTAQFLWDLFCSSQNLAPSELSAAYASHFGIPLSQAESDVSETLHAWSQSLLSDGPTPTKTHAKTGQAFSPQEPRSTPLSTLSFTLGCASFCLRVHDPAVVAEFQPRFAHITTSVTAEAAHDRHTFAIFRADGRDTNEPIILRNLASNFLATAPDATVARVLLVQEIARLAQTPTIPDWLAILHAAALAHPVTNQAIILPAATGSGKSTLSAALLHSGLRFLSDDSAALTTSGTLLPIPGALMLRTGSWPILQSLFPNIPDLPIHDRYHEPVRYLTPPAADAVNLTPALPKAIVFPVRHSGPHPASFNQINSLQALVSLQKAGFWVPHTQPSIAAFLSWFLSVPAYEFQYSSLSDAVLSLTDFLGFPG